MALIEATAEAVLSLGTTLPSRERKPDLADRFDEMIREIQGPHVIFFPDGSDGKTSQDPDVRAVAELVARLVHPSNEDRQSHITGITMPRSGDNEYRIHHERVGTIGTVALHLGGDYEREGVEKRGLIAWHGAFYTPGKATERTVFRSGNLDRSTLKLVEFSPGVIRPTTYLLPTTGDRLDTRGVFLMPEKSVVGSIARSLNNSAESQGKNVRAASA